MAPDQSPEARLGRLSRLPWFRHAYMPDYLRERLLRQLARRDRRRIRQAYELVLDRLSVGQDGSDATELVLPIEVSAARRARRRLADLFRTHRRGGTLDDPIFANILRGGRLGPLDFRLPRRVEKRIPGGRLLVNLTPAVLALATAGAIAWGLHYGWQRGTMLLADLYTRKIQAENAGWAVTIQDVPETFLLAEALNQTLLGQGFSVSKTSASPASGSGNVLRYPAGSEPVARRIEAELRHASFGAPVDLQQDPALADRQMRLVLGETYRPGAVFRDAAVNPVGAPRPAPFSVFQDRYTVPDPDPGSNAGVTLELRGPPMVALPSGAFRMGCVENSKDCIEDEKPVRAVTVKPFALGRDEVTFEDYDRFAERVQQEGGCRDERGQPLDLKIEKPDDWGWGRGRRPVINVNWDQARCYAEWLSRKTGQRYRLPTEAEWEYAVRSGTATAWYWGDDAEAAGLYAWYSGNSDGSIHPSGGKRTNAFGLHDMAGNLWEWTADCWHGNYQGAPADGSAWLEADQGDCSRRVVRGGSWYNFPQSLRSALRNRFWADGAFNVLGFRVARDL